MTVNIYAQTGTGGVCYEAMISRCYVQEEAEERRLGDSKLLQKSSLRYLIRSAT